LSPNCNLIKVVSTNIRKLMLRKGVEYDFLDY
jgi:hypothetical protein